MGARWLDGGEALLSRKWLEINLQRVGTEIQATALGCRGERALPHMFGPEADTKRLSQFTEQVREAAESNKPPDSFLSQAQRLHQALFQGELQEVLVRLHEVAGGDKLLLRLMLPHDGLLQELPWEALCAPRTNHGFLGSSTDVSLARGVISKEPLEARKVRQAVRLLAITPSDVESFTGLRAALEESIAAGEIQWLEPLMGINARLPYLLDRLKRGPVPHILHFFGHGSVSREGKPLLQLRDKDGEETWIPVELLAQHLREGFRESLRLIVLDACQGAEPGAFASAAELLTRGGADAVVAHLWPVRADIARECSKAFYRALTGTDQPWGEVGDVALSLNEARRRLLTEFSSSAEAFSPVLYLRGNDSVLFDFSNRRILPPSSPSPPVEASAVDAGCAALQRLRKEPFTLVLGDRWKDEQALLNDFRARLHRKLTWEVKHLPPSMSMSALTQHYALRFTEQKLDDEFQAAFGETLDEFPLMRTLARTLVPGFHISLLRHPLLELTLAQEQPKRPLYVIQPSGLAPGEPATVRTSKRGSLLWEDVAKKELPESFDLKEDIVILRNYCGYMPPHIFRRPLITEDQYLLSINELASMRLDSMLPMELADSLMVELNTRPVLLLGLSMLTWHHRMLLNRLFGRSQIRKSESSLVVLEPGETERMLWAEGRLLPVKGIQVVELCAGDLEKCLSEEAVAGEP
jgi:CHAT domain-containing protein